MRSAVLGFTPGLRIFSATCVGGASIFNQISDLRRKPNFVIGTPGRLKDPTARLAHAASVTPPRSPR